MSHGQRLVALPVHTHPLAHVYEAFGGIVAAVADGTHAVDQIVAAKKALLIVAGELSPLSE
ncbi:MULTISPECIES: hypothetical protein [Salinisphaera]|uniref:hypothetical protein n=1 Tax=Salinisphaera TaxID=180541 RepID=UPI00333FE057